MKTRKDYEQGYSDAVKACEDRKKYNGWNNYETWVVKLWMDNDQGSYEYWQERTESAVKDALGFDNSSDVRHEAETALIEELKAWHDEIMPKVEGVFADLLNAAMSEVDWYEIAGAMVGDYLADNPEVLVEEEAE